MRAFYFKILILMSGNQHLRLDNSAFSNNLNNDQHGLTTLIFAARI